MVFVNRVQELGEFDGLLQSEGPQLVLLYGRRRLGKTALLRRIRDKHGGLYFQVPDQAESGILRHLNDRLQEQTGRPVSYASIHDFLQDLGSHGERFVILDEAQRLFEASKGSASLLQEVWDGRLKDQGMVLALCGSVIGTLEALLDAKSPLYGRITYNHHLRPFTYQAVRQFYPKLTERERLERYAVLGATPHYHDINLERAKLLDAIQYSFLSRGAPLREEPRTLFAIEFQKPDRYHEILEAMGRGAQSLGEVAQYYSGRKASDYTPYFEVLRDRLRIVTDMDPVGGKKRRKRIGFADPFFRFYYGHIYPNMDRIELRDEEGVLAEIQDALPSLVGRVWESVCREWMVAMQGRTHDGVEIRFRELGSWWDGEEELDVVALDDGVAYCGECKFQSRPVPKKDLEALKRRGEQVTQANGCKDLHLFLWTASGLDPGAKAYAREHGIHVLDVETVVAGLA